MTSMSWWCAHAWLDRAEPGVEPGVRDRVRIVAGADGRITSLICDVDPDPDDHRLPGLVLPGFANTHSHAFHRALRGRTHGEVGTFWTWRDRMYALADRLDPDTYRAAGDRRLRRDGPRRGDLRRGVPLPAPRPRRRPLRGPQRDG